MRFDSVVRYYAVAVYPREMSQPAHITGQVTFLYYTDLAAPRRFYEDTLRLRRYYEQDWITVYHTTRTAGIGIVKVNRSRSNRSKSDTLMISLSLRTWTNGIVTSKGILL